MPLVITATAAYLADLSFIIYVVILGPPELLFYGTGRP